MRLIYFLAFHGSFAFAGSESATNLDHHGRWVTAALLTETLVQELETAQRLALDQPAHLGAQVLFVKQLAEKIGYSPTHSVKVSGVTRDDAQRAMKRLDHGEKWAYLSHKKNKLRPLCRETARSHECRTFLALQGEAASQQAVSAALQTLAREKPQQYAQANIRSYHALLLLRQKNYPETLRVLYDIQLSDSKFKLLYNKIQRIYSVTQKGGGEVVLRQTL